MSRNYADEGGGTVRSTTSSSDQVHYLHSGTVRSKLIVLKPESTFTSKSDRRKEHGCHPGHFDHSLSHSERKGSYLSSDQMTHGRMSLLDGRLTSGRLVPRQRCTRKLCLCLAVAVVSVIFGAAVGVYFGFRILESETTKVKEFRGAFRVVSGDNYTEELVDMFSDSFLSRSRLYKAKLDTIFSNSVLKKAYLGSEILAIDPGETLTGEDVIVRFNIRMDPGKIDVDAGDVYLVLINEIMKAQQTTTTITVDEESIEVHERRSKFSPNRLSPLSTLPVNRASLDSSRMVTFASSREATDDPFSPDSQDKGGGDPLMAADEHWPLPTRLEVEPQADGVNSNILESMLSGSDSPLQPTTRDRSTRRHIKTTPPSVMRFGVRETTPSNIMSQYKEIYRPKMQTAEEPSLRRTKTLPPDEKHHNEEDPEAELSELAHDGQETEEQFVRDVISQQQDKDLDPTTDAKSTELVLRQNSHMRVSTALPQVSPPPPRSVATGGGSGGSLASPPRILSIMELAGRPTTSKASSKDRLVVVPFSLPRRRPTDFNRSRVKTTLSPQETAQSLRTKLNSGSTPTQQRQKSIVIVPFKRLALNSRRTTTTVKRGSNYENRTTTLSGRRTTTKTTSKKPQPLTPTSLLPYLPLLIHNRQCVPPGLNLCSTFRSNLTSFSELASKLHGIDIGPIADFIRGIVDSGCFEYADYFVCQLLQPGCDHGTPILPCRGFCQNFLDKCRHMLPETFLVGLTCNFLPEEKNGKCVGKPECVHQVRNRGQDHLVCDGIVDCYDMSDETRCKWCAPGQFVCGGKKCIDKTFRCDGKADCPNEADERNCRKTTIFALAESALDAAHAHPYTQEGFVFLNDKGAMGKICADTLLKSIPKERRDVVLKNVGESACELLNYRDLSFVDTREDSDSIGPYFHILNPLSWRVTFLEAPCQTKNVVYIGCSNFVCGKRPSHTPTKMLHYMDRNKLVALADHGDWPWHAALYNDGHHICDATLVDDQWLLTSSTCFQGLPSGVWYARIGLVRLDSSAPFQQRRRVIGRLHSPIRGSDVMLVKLQSPVMLTDFVRPVCLPLTSQIFPTGKKCITLGWDFRHIFSENHLRQVTVTLTETEECLWRWPVGKAHVFCTAEPPGMLTECQGEDQSGGPLLCDDNGTWFLVGIVNWRIGCGLSKQPRLYDNVAVNTRWIQMTIQNHKHEPSLSQEIVDM